MHASNDIPRTGPCRALRGQTQSQGCVLMFALGLANIHGLDSTALVLYLVLRQENVQYVKDTTPCRKMRLKPVTVDQH